MGRVHELQIPRKAIVRSNQYGAPGRGRKVDGRAGRGMDASRRHVT